MISSDFSIPSMPCSIQNSIADLDQKSKESLCKAETIAHPFYEKIWIHKDYQLLIPILGDQAGLWKNFFSLPFEKTLEAFRAIQPRIPLSFKKMIVTEGFRFSIQLINQCPDQQETILFFLKEVDLRNLVFLIPFLPAPILEQQEVKQRISGEQFKQIQEVLANKSEPFLTFTKLLPLFNNIPSARHLDDGADHFSKLFAHTFGDFFIRHSTYEGSVASKNLTTYVQFLDWLKLESNPFFKLDLPESLIDLFKNLQTVEKYENSVANKTLQKKFETKIKLVNTQLNKHGSVCFMGGWKSGTYSSGHAMIYEIEKKSSNLPSNSNKNKTKADDQSSESSSTYILKVYNTGEGIKHHLSTQDSTKPLYAPYYKVEFTQDPQELLTLISDLLKFCALCPTVETERLNGNFIYSFLQTIPGKHNQLTQEELEILKFISSQQSGSCASRVYKALVGAKLAWHDYKRFRFLFKFFLLLQFDTSLDQFEQSYVNRNQSFILVNSIEKFIRQLKGYYHHNIIDMFELLVSLNLCVEKYQTANINKPQSTFLHLSPFEIKDKINYKYFKELSKTKTNSELIIKGDSFESLVIKDDPTKDDFLLNFFSKIDNRLLTSTYSENYLRSFIKKAPLISSFVQGEFYSKLTEEQVGSMLRGMNTLHMYLFKNKTSKHSTLQIIINSYFYYLTYYLTEAGYRAKGLASPFAGCHIGLDCIESLCRSFDADIDVQDQQIDLLLINRNLLNKINKDLIQFDINKESFININFKNDTKPNIFILVSQNLAQIQGVQNYTKDFTNKMVEEVLKDIRLLLNHAPPEFHSILSFYFFSLMISTARRLHFDIHFYETESIMQLSLGEEPVEDQTHSSTLQIPSFYYFLNCLDTVNFLQKNMTFLVYPQVQKQLIANFFQMVQFSTTYKTLFEKELIAPGGKVFLKNVTKLLKAAYDFAIQNKKFQLLHFLIYFENQVDDQLPSNMKDDFPAAHNIHELKELIYRFIDHPEIYEVITALLLFQTKSLSEQEKPLYYFSALISASLSEKAASIRELLAQFLIDNNCELSDFFEMLMREQFTALIANISQIIGQPISAEKWLVENPRQPLFVKIDHLSIDFASGRVFGLNRNALPAAATKSPVFAELISHEYLFQQPHTLQVDNRVNKRGKKNSNTVQVYLDTLSPTKVYHLQSQLSYYFLQIDHQLAEKYFQNNFKINLKDFVNAKEFFVVNSLDLKDPHYQMETFGNIDLIIQKNFGSKAYFCWVGTNSSPSNFILSNISDNEVYLFEYEVKQNQWVVLDLINKNKLLYNEEFTKSANQVYHQENDIPNYDDNSKQILKDIHMSLIRLNQLDHMSGITFWENSDGLLSQVKLLQYNLNFTLKKVAIGNQETHLLFSEEYPHYYIDSQVANPFKRLNACLVLKNSDGKQLMIIPSAYSHNNPNGRINHHITHPKYFHKYVEKQHHICFVKAPHLFFEEWEKWEAENVELLYLFQLLLKSNHYHEAFYYLQKCKAQFEYNQKFIERLSKILTGDLNDEIAIDHPNYFALIMHLYSLYLSFDLSSEADALQTKIHQKVSLSYLSYIRKLKDINSEFLLTRLQEKEIVSVLKKYSHFISYRFAIFFGAKDLILQNYNRSSQFLQIINSAITMIQNLSKDDVYRFNFSPIKETGLFYTEFNAGTYICQIFNSYEKILAAKKKSQTIPSKELEFFNNVKNQSLYQNKNEIHSKASLIFLLVLFLENNLKFYGQDRFIPHSIQNHSNPRDHVFNLIKYYSKNLIEFAKHLENQFIATTYPPSTTPLFLGRNADNRTHSGHHLVQKFFDLKNQPVEQLEISKKRKIDFIDKEPKKYLKISDQAAAHLNRYPLQSLAENHLTFYETAHFQGEFPLKNALQTTINYFERASLISLEEGFQKLPRTIQRYRWNEGCNIQTLSNSLKLLHDQISEELKLNLETIRAILKVGVDIEASQWLEQVFNFINSKLDFTKNLNIKKIIDWYLHYSIESKAVSLDQNALFQKLEAFLKLKTQQDQIERAVKEIAVQEEAKAIEIIKTAPIETESYLLNRIQSFFESLTGKVLRTNQVEMLLKSDESSKAVYQLKGGEGKTQVLTVLLILIELAKNQLPITIVPSNNLHVDQKRLNQSLFQFNEKGSTYFAFDRNKMVKNSYLEDVYFKLQNIIEGKAGITSLFETFPTLFLCYLEETLQWSLSDESEIPVERFSLYEKIFKYLLEKGTAIVDEWQSLFDVMRTIIFAISSSDSVTVSLRKKTTAILFQYLTNYFELNEIDSFTGKNFNKDKYNSEMRKYLVDEFTFYFQKEYSLDENYVRFYLSTPRLELTSEATLALNQWLGTMIEFAENELKMIRALLEVTLPSLLKLKHFVNYGPSPRTLEAVPYLFNRVPSLEDTFSQYETKSILSFFSYLHEGLKPDQSKNLFIKLSQLQIERTRENLPSIDAQLIMDYDLLKLDFSDENLLQTLHSRYSKNPKFIYEYFKLFVMSSLSAEGIQISASCYDFAALFKKIIGFSATPNNYLTYPHHLETHFNLAGNAESLQLLNDPNRTELILVDHVDLGSLITEKTGLIIDPSHYFSEKQQAVAELILKHLPKTKKGVIFYESISGEPQRLFKETINSAEIDDSNLYVTYCDEARTEGTHHSLKAGSEACLIINQITWTKLEQGMRRLFRGDHAHQQKLFLVIPNEIQGIIQDRYGEVTVKTLIQWSNLNEAQMLSKKILPGALQEVKSYYRMAYFKKCLYSDISDKKEFIKGHRSLIEDLPDEKAYEELASLSAPKTALEIFEDFFSSLQKLYPHLLDENQTKELQQIREKNCLLLKELVYELEAELAVEKKIEQNIEKEINQETVLKKIDPFKLQSWDPVSSFNWIEAKDAQPSLKRASANEDILRIKSIRKFFPDCPDFFSDNIYFTSNFINQIYDKDQVNYEMLWKNFAQTNYGLIMANRRSEKYILLHPFDADLLRTRYPRGNSNFWLFDLNGTIIEQWIRSNLPMAKQFSTILPQLKLIQGLTVFNSINNDNTTLLNWIYNKEIRNPVNALKSLTKFIDVRFGAYEALCFNQSPLAQALLKKVCYRLESEKRPVPEVMIYDDNPFNFDSDVIEYTVHTSHTEGTSNHVETQSSLNLSSLASLHDMDILTDWDIQDWINKP